MALSENRSHKTLLFTLSQEDNLNKVATILKFGGYISYITSLVKQTIEFTNLLKETSKLFLRYNEKWKKLLYKLLN